MANKNTKKGSGRRTPAEIRRERLRQRRLIFSGIAVVVVVAAVTVGAVAMSGGDETPQAAPTGSPSPAMGEPRDTVCENASPDLIGRRTVKQQPYPMSIDEKGKYEAQVSTSCGTMLIELLPKKAPVAVNNFVNLADGNYFTGMVFHRVDKGAGQIQSGDPTCPSSTTDCGTGGPGYTLPDEFPNGLKPKVGTVAMANLGEPDSSGSQFVIVAREGDPALSPDHTIFGRLVGSHSLRVADLILTTPTEVAPLASPGAPADFPSTEYVYITNVKIIEGSKGR